MEGEKREELWIDGQDAIFLVLPVFTSLCTCCGHSLGTGESEMVGGRLWELKREHIQWLYSVEVVTLSSGNFIQSFSGGQWFNSQRLLFI
jgi:hypothetical protein